MRCAERIHALSEAHWWVLARRHAQATTPMDPRVLDAMLPHMTGMYGNPHSRSHSYGWEAADGVAHARQQVADLISADPKEIIFTSGATESNNMSIKGVGRFYRPKKNHIITVSTEHKCVLDSCRQMETEGMRVTYLPVQTNGLVDMAQLEAAITDDTALVSVMAINNEIGVLQPVEEIGRLCRQKKVRPRTAGRAAPAAAGARRGVRGRGRRRASARARSRLRARRASPSAGGWAAGRAPPGGRRRLSPSARAPARRACLRQVFFHCDAAQALGKIPVDVDAWNVDLMSISGHKVYGPKGVGALYVRRRPRVRLEPVINGGGQERGLRSGTLPHPLVVGLGAACEVAAHEMERDAAHISRLSQKLRTALVERVPHITINGDVDQRYCGNLNVSFAYVEGESLIMALKDIAVSSGSACTSDSLEPSYVLRALGVEEDMAHTSIRFGIGRFTTEGEVRASAAGGPAASAAARPPPRAAHHTGRPARAWHPRRCDAQVDHAINMCVRHVERLRQMSPLWEMVQEGVDLSKIQWTQH